MRSAPEHIGLLREDALGSELYLSQVLYEQIGSISAPVTTPFQQGDDRSNAYIVVGFKPVGLTYNNLFEENWKDMTGARQIYLQLPPHLGLSTISFLRRIKPKEINNFAYILFVVCTNVTEQNLPALLDFVHRLRMRMLGNVAVYKEHQHNKLTSLLQGMAPEVMQNYTTLEIVKKHLQ